MAQAGFTPIITYHSTTPAAVPTAGNLAPGELALNIADMKLYAENSSGVVTLLAQAGSGTGTVTSVSGTGTVNGLTLTGTVTTSGSLTLGGTLSNVSLTTAVTGTLPIANGGTGQTSAQAAINSLAGAVTSGSYLRGNGTNVVMSTIQAGDVPTLNQNTTGTASNVTGTVAVANGGTGGTTQAAGRTGLGATTIGSNLFTLTNPGAITFPRFNADNTVSSLDAATFRTAIGAGTGAGTVTSVGGTGTVNGLTLTGTVTSSGNLTLGGTLSGVSLTTAVTGTLPIANGGTGSTATAYCSLTTNVSGILPAANGGTNNAFFQVSGPATSTKTYTFPNENMTVVGTTQTQTLTSKRVTPRIDTVASAATITPTGDSSDQYTVTALATAATIAAPSGTPTDGQKLVIRIKDNGTARALTWTTTSGAYRACGVTLPTTTVISKVVYIGCIYNSQDLFWDVIAVAQQP